MMHHFIDIDGIRTHYIEAGQGGPRTVILLHGGGVDNADLSWGLLIPTLSADHHVIAFDWPGYGESAKPRLDYSAAFNVQFLAHFMDALHLERVSLVGLSMGGAAALGFALQSPARVEKLVLADSYGLQRAAAFHRASYLMIRTPGVNALTWAMMKNRAMIRYTLQALLKRPGSITDELVDKAYRQIQQPGASYAWTTYQKSEALWSGTRTCYMDQLDGLSLPTLIIHGTKDDGVPVDCAKEANARIRGSQLHWMEGCGHWAQRDNPEAFNRVAAEFLRA